MSHLLQMQIVVERWRRRFGRGVRELQLLSDVLSPVRVTVARFVDEKKRHRLCFGRPEL